MQISLIKKKKKPKSWSDAIIEYITQFFSS